MSVVWRARESENICRCKKSKICAHFLSQNCNLKCKFCIAINQSTKIHSHNSVNVNKSINVSWKWETKWFLVWCFTGLNWILLIWNLCVLTSIKWTNINGCSQSLSIKMTKKRSSCCDSFTRIQIIDFIIEIKLLLGDSIEWKKNVFAWNAFIWSISMFVSGLIKQAIDNNFIWFYHSHWHVQWFGKCNNSFFSNSGLSNTMNV